MWRAAGLLGGPSPVLALALCTLLEPGLSFWSPVCCPLTHGVLRVCLMGRCSWPALWAVLVHSGMGHVPLGCGPKATTY